jgi:hypothetical protein
MPYDSADRGGGEAARYGGRLAYLPNRLSAPQRSPWIRFSTQPRRTGKRTSDPPKPAESRPAHELETNSSSMLPGVSPHPKLVPQESTSV